MTDGPITSFTGEYSFLSNFYPSRIEMFDLYFATAEAAFQACKTRVREEQVRIALANTPSVAKRIGRSVKLRPNWDRVRVQFMRQVVWAKFTQHPDLAERLIATGDRELIEGNTWGDLYWGRDLLGNGENHLGQILMRTRTKLQEGEAWSPGEKPIP